MITLCWAAKGGSGTTVVAAAMALVSSEPTLIVDLGGDLPTVLGVPEPDGPGVHDWLRSEAAPPRLSNLEIDIAGQTALLPAGHIAPADPTRWAQFAAWLERERRVVIIDAGSRRPPTPLFEASDQALLVTRPCYLALRAAIRQTPRPSGVILIEEPGRTLGRSDIEASLGCPVVASILCDPAIARAVDAGLLVSRLPAGLRRQLRGAAA